MERVFIGSGELEYFKFSENYNPGRFADYCVPELLALAGYEAPVS